MGFHFIGQGQCEELWRGIEQCLNNAAGYAVVCNIKKPNLPGRLAQPCGQCPACGFVVAQHGSEVDDRDFLECGQPRAEPAINLAWTVAGIHQIKGRRSAIHYLWLSN